jgi:hypothetical protein
VGGGHLSRLLLLGIALAVAAPAAAASTVPFRVAAHGISAGAPTAKPFAILGTSPVSGHRIVLRVPMEVAQPVLAANFRKQVVLGVFGPFGCEDRRVRVVRLTQTGKMLVVHLSLKPPDSGMMECQAIYETARVLVVSRAALHGTPTKATVAGP